METLMVQANSGMYRVHDTYFEACKQKLQKQDSKMSSEWESFDMANLWPRNSQDSSNPGSESEKQNLATPIVGQDIFFEESTGSFDNSDNESEWSLDIP